MEISTTKEIYGKSFTWNIGTVSCKESVSTKDLGVSDEFCVNMLFDYIPEEYKYFLEFDFIYYLEPSTEIDNQIKFKDMLLQFAFNVTESTINIHERDCSKGTITRNKKQGSYSIKYAYDIKNSDSYNYNYGSAVYRQYTNLSINFSNVFVTVLTERNNMLHYLNHMNDLLNDGLYSDLELKVKDRIFKVHKCILSSRSIVFKNMLENDMSEKNTNLIDFTSHDPEVVAESLAFIYTNKCNFSKDPVALFKLANYLDIEELKLKCVKYLEYMLNFKNVVGVLKLIELDTWNYSLSNLRVAVNKFIDINEIELIKQDDYIQYLTENVRIDNIDEILRIADSYKLQNLLNVAMKFIKQNYSQIKLDNQKCISYLKMHADLLLEFCVFLMEI